MGKILFSVRMVLRHLCIGKQTFEIPYWSFAPPPIFDDLILLKWIKQVVINYTLIDNFILLILWTYNYLLGSNWHQNLTQTKY